MGRLNEFRNKDLAGNYIRRIRATSRKPIRIMEVCGTHTQSIFKSGVRSLLPETITLLSGPGCPVCVTSQEEIDRFIALSQIEGVILATFGDLMRVPGTGSSLEKEKASGRDIRMVYSPLDAVAMARNNPDKKVIFPGVGFETTAPVVGAAILTAARESLTNFFVHSAHKLVPPALFALMALTGNKIDGFILPGHVSVMIGMGGYRPFFEQFRIPSVISGFEPLDILRGISSLVRQIESGEPALENLYERAVRPQGNPKALAIMNQVFEQQEASWRGIGRIPESGLSIRETHGAFDAAARFQVAIPETKNQPGCMCGEILTGAKNPPQCPCYKRSCTPSTPLGPCMVSTEGTCSAYFRFYDDHPIKRRPHGE
jgi:hydrogenase expression/formation protein HypD